MGFETIFCKKCSRDTLHIEGECVDCSIRRDIELHEKLESDVEALERARIESKRRPK